MQREGLVSLMYSFVNLILSRADEEVFKIQTSYTSSYFNASVNFKRFDEKQKDDYTVRLFQNKIRGRIAH